VTCGRWDVCSMN